MSELAFVGILALLLMSSLGAAALMHQRAERDKQRRAKIRLHGRAIARYSHAIKSLSACDREPAVAQDLNSLRLSHASALIQLDPFNRNAQLSHQEAMEFEYRKLGIRASGLALEGIVEGLKDINTLYQERRTRGEINDSELGQVTRHIRELDFNLAIEVLLERAEAALKRNDRAGADYELRQALSKVIQAGEDFPGGAELASEIRERIGDLEKGPSEQSGSESLA